jgi:hypothetical protein
MWKWLEGKKTKIGAALMLIAQAGQAVAPEYAAVWAIVNNAGMLFAGVGLAHSGAKKVINV